MVYLNGADKEPEDTKSTEVFSKMLSLPESSSPITWTTSAAKELNFPA